MQAHLLIIDPQNDFCDGPANGALPVPGAYDDLSRVAALVRRLGGKLDDIHVTLDSHRVVDIAHPIWWVDRDGNPPAPFTLIERKDVLTGTWSTRNPGARTRSLAYLESLETAGKYRLIIWPPHCLIGTPGHNVHPELAVALRQWEEDNYAAVDYVTKGSNPWTEHYSAVQAEVPDPEDPGTMMNAGLLDALQAADVIAIAGEALSHCVKSTVTDIADAIGDAYVQKFVFLTDASSPVPGFEAEAKGFIDTMVGRGMRLATTATFLQ